MKGDFTRQTFDRSKHYRGVVMQQGRVQLDADWNESRAIDSHLLQTLARDVIGDCGVPIHVDAFKVGLPGTIDPLKSDFTISAGPAGQGRMYVGGLLCEIESDTTYLTQPDWLSAPGSTSLANLGPAALGPLKAGETRIDLVYIDVWPRAISAIEDPHIREVALGGPDTAERLKLIWQVKVKADVDSQTSCSTPLGLPTIGGGTLQLIVTTPPTPPDPCEPTAQGGYQGPDNRFYRIEIHDSGPLGTATFKWSRDNGSVVASIEQFKSATEIVVKSLGRDDYLNFKTGDIVEVTDDAIDLSDLPGTLASITVDEASRTLTLNKSIPDAVRLATGRHPKVRRWDGGNAQKINNGVFDLEAGLKIQFGSTATDFRSGDYWTFAARVVDGSVDPELATPTPPMGVHHAYCHLALITWTNDGKSVTAKIQDCRLLFPPLTELPATGEGCCTVTVGDGVTSHGDFTDIQAAIDSLKDGGRVCILPGEYPLRSPVKFSRDEVIVSGCGPQSHIIAPDAEPAFIISNSNRIYLESLFVTGQATDGLVVIDDSRTVRVTDCEITNAAGTEKKLRGAIFLGATAPGPAIAISSGMMLTLAGNTLFGLPAISLQAQIADVIDNHLTGGGIWLRDGAGQVRLLGNDIERGLGSGVILGGLGQKEKPSDRYAGVESIQIVDNQILRMAGSGISTLAVSPTVARQLGDITDVVIADNYIAGCVRPTAQPVLIETIAAGGVVLNGVAQVRIHHNTIVENGLAQQSAACGVFVYMSEGLTITDNTVVDNGSPGSSAQQDCVDFSAMKAGPGPNPRPEIGATFTAFDSQGQPVKETRIDAQKNVVGLYCGSSLEIKLGQPSTSVALTLFNTHAGARLEAFNQDGSSAGTYQVPTQTTQTITVNGDSIARIKIIGDETWLLKVCFNTANAGFQAGIVALYAISPWQTIANPNLYTEKIVYIKEQPSLPSTGWPAAMIHDNVVVCPQGQALIVVALGPTSISDNTLVSHGHRSQPSLPGLNQAQTAELNAVIGAVGDVLIFNLGQPRDGVSSLRGNVTTHYDLYASKNETFGMAASQISLPDGRTSIHGNQVTFQDNTKASVLPSVPVLLLSADDISVQDNQILSETPQALLLFDVVAFGGTVRASSNRFTELPARAWLSYISYGQLMNIATGNQSTHCIYVGGAQKIDSPNQQLAAAFCDQLMAILGGK